VPRTLAPLLAALVGLAGSLAVTLYLHATAASAVDGLLEARLRSAGETAAELLGRVPPTPQALRAVMQANGLEGAYLVSPSLRIQADATGRAGRPADLLRVDAGRVARAFLGQPSVDFAFSFGELKVASGYFPVRAPEGEVAAVLALEAGRTFVAPRTDLRRALFTGIALSFLAALALGTIALRWSRIEAHRLEAAERAARGDLLARMAAMAAHEIRNPLGVIRGAVELVRARSGAALSGPDQVALGDALGEVERLRRLTEDLLDVAREPALTPIPVDLAEVAAEAARAHASAYPSTEVRLAVPRLPVQGDPVRLQQVVRNLLQNAAQAGARVIQLRGEAVGGQARLRVEDDGPGVPGELRERLFAPFASGRAGGRGLGLAIARRIVVRHGGTLELVDRDRPGGTFELRIPLEAT
jgi:two-component system, OmpR family, sensor kinase